MKKQNRIFICGPEGVGKTTLIHNILERKDTYSRVSGSALICGRSAAYLDYAKLRQRSLDEVMADQQNIATSFDALCNKHRASHFFFDGHVFVSYGEGKSVVVPSHILKLMQVTRLIFLDVPPETIVQRRKENQHEKTYPSLDVEAVRKEVALYKDAVLQLSKETGIPYSVIPEANKVKSLLATLHF